jgi:hypothetical protein
VKISPLYIRTVLSQNFSAKIVKKMKNFRYHPGNPYEFGERNMEGNLAASACESQETDSPTSLKSLSLPHTALFICIDPLEDGGHLKGGLHQVQQDPLQDGGYL